MLEIICQGSNAFVKLIRVETSIRLKRLIIVLLSDSGLVDPSSVDNGLDMRESDFDLRGYSPELDEILEKRMPVMRFGKRNSLLRFGKRGSLFRFGKRGSLMRFGKKNGFDEADSDDFSSDYPYSSEPEFDPYEAIKRGSLLRFGKKSSLMRFGRSANIDKKPHTPWRFGREEDYY